MTFIFDMKIKREELLIFVVLALALYGFIAVLTDSASFVFGYMLGSELDNCSDLALSALENLGCRWKKW